MSISCLKNVFSRTGTGQDLSTPETFYVHLPTRLTLFNDFFKQTGLNPKDILNEKPWSPLNQTGEMLQNNDRYFMFQADPEAVQKASEATGLAFNQEFSVTLDSSKIHNFSEAAQGLEFFVPPSERKSGPCPYIIRGNPQAIEKAADQWGIDVQKTFKGMDQNTNAMPDVQHPGNFS